MEVRYVCVKSRLYKKWSCLLLTGWRSLTHLIAFVVDATAATACSSTLSASRWRWISSDWQSWPVFANNQNRIVSGREENGQMITQVKWGRSLDENIADRHKVITDDNGRQTLQTMRDRCIIKSSPPVSHMTTWHCVLQLPLGWEVVQKTLQKFAGSANLPRYMQFILDFHKWWTFTKNGWLDIFSTHCWVVQLKWSCQIVFICCELFG